MHVLRLVASVVLLSLTGFAPPQIRLSDYCTSPAATTHDDCIAQWVEAGRLQPGRVLFADAGTYRYSTAVAIYSTMKLECRDSARTTFQNVGGNGTFLDARAPVHNVEIRRCGFDVNGNATNFLAVIAINPQDAPGTSADIDVRRNRFFDGTLPGTTSSAQRQYVALLNCNDCEVAENHLSGGGRIKVGRPGRELEIERNVVEHVNDNAISVVDITPDGVSSEIEITHNRIIMPLGVGIFLGADGQKTPGVSMTTRRVRVERNRIAGNWTTSCIQATLPENADHITIRHNECVKTGATVPFAAGISLIRTNDATVPTRRVHIENNSVTAGPGLPAGTTALDYGGIFVNGAHDHVCIRNNTVAGVSSRAIFIKGTLTNARLTPNTLVGGTLTVDGSVSPPLP